MHARSLVPVMAALLLATSGSAADARPVGSARSAEPVTAHRPADPEPGDTFGAALSALPPAAH